MLPERFGLDTKESRGHDLIKVFLVSRDREPQAAHEGVRLSKAPIAIEAAERINALSAIERDLNGAQVTGIEQLRNRKKAAGMPAAEVPAST